MVTCGGEEHRVTWRRGKIVLDDHDLSAERGMLAFGGEMCECMRVLAMWVEQFRMSSDQFLSQRKWLGPHAHLAPAAYDLQRRLAMILTWERSWRTASYVNDKEARLLDVELKDKALEPLRRHLTAWKQRTGARVVSGCQVALVPSSVAATVEGTMDRVAMRAAARLHARWVVDVWPRGIAVVEDAFVVELIKAVSVDDLRVLAVRWKPSGTGTWATVAEEASVRRDAGGDGQWRLTWDGT
jgi:hypothetical protein